MRCGRRLQTFNQKASAAKRQRCRAHLPRPSTCPLRSPARPPPPRCGHCKSLAPAFSKAASILRDFDPNVLLAKVDATVEVELAEQFNVEGYPTILFFRKGTPKQYDGGREACASERRPPSTPPYCPLAVDRLPSPLSEKQCSLLGREEIVSWIKRKTAPPLKQIDDLQESVAFDDKNVRFLVSSHPHRLAPWCLQPQHCACPPRHV